MHEDEENPPSVGSLMENEQPDSQPSVTDQLKNNDAVSNAEGGTQVFLLLLKLPIFHRPQNLDLCLKFTKSFFYLNQ